MPCLNVAGCQAAGRLILCSANFRVGTALTAGSVMLVERDPVRQPYNVVLLGASIGRAWNLPTLPARMDDRRFVIETFAVWQFDKTSMLMEILMRPRRKCRLRRSYFRSLFQPPPRVANAIILKECSSYFPGDVLERRRLVEGWVNSIARAGIVPILATVAPITDRRSALDEAKMNGIREYNDWIRSYANERRLPLLDLEMALRIDPVKRYLRNDLTSGDGSHLNALAYSILDEVLWRTLMSLKAPNTAQIGKEMAEPCAK